MKFLIQFIVFLSYLLPVTILSPVCAQNADLRFDHLTTDDGLSQNKINCILQDSKGFMWFGTNEGLNKYDGFEFSTFGKDSGRTDRLSDDYIQCIYEDSNKNIWIGTGGGGLDLFDRVSNKFIHLSRDSSSGIHLMSDNIRAIIEDRRGKLWIATDISIESIDLQNKIVHSFIPDHFKSPGTLFSSINVLFVDESNYLWIGTNGAGLCRFDQDTKTFKYYKHDPQNSKSISNNDIRSLYIDMEGNFWVGTYNGGFNLFDRVSGTFTRYIPDPDIRESLTVRAIMDNTKGSLWIGTRNGVYLLEKQTQRFSHSAHDVHNPYSLSQNNIQAIYRDTKGNFWFGTKGGVNYLNTASMVFSHFRADDYKQRGLNYNMVTSVFEDSYGDLWFATNERGLNRLDNKTGTFTYFTHDPADPQSLGSNNINTIIEDRKGKYWIGTFQGGLNYFNRKTNRFIRYKLIPGKPLRFQPGIESLLIDKNGILWLGTSGMGVLRFDRKKESFSAFFLNSPDPEPTIRCMTDYNGKILAGSSNSRIYIIDPLMLESSVLKIPTSTDYTLINDIKIDADKNLWIGTSGGGLFFYDMKHKSFKIFKQKDGLTNNFIQGIVIDDKGDLWLSTINGLTHFDPDTKKMKNYFKENGLISNQFTRARFESESGEIFLGTIKGAISFHPAKIIENSYAPPVVLTDFTIFNKPVNIGGEDAVLTENITDAAEINLSYKHTVFTFTYAALDYAAGELNHYAYVMEGFEKDWNFVGNRRFATYTNLNPGSYVFRVKVTNSHGVKNGSEASVRIYISPPFWETWWFKMIITAILLFITWHIFNYLKQKRDLLKATSLANLTQLKLLRNQMNPHFLLNTFSAIRALVLIDKKHAWQSISELSDYFRYVLLNYNKIEASLNDEIDAAKNYINIQRLLNDSLEISFKSDEVACKCIVPAFLFQPLIENAIIHGHEINPTDLKIKIHLAYVDGILSIDVSNTGKLFEPAKTKSIQDKVHGTSIKNIKKRLELMFGNLYTFRLFEADGMVHAKIEINYDEKMSQKKVAAEYADIDQ